MCSSIMKEFASVFAAVDGNIITFAPRVATSEESHSVLLEWKRNAICPLTNEI